MIGETIVLAQRLAWRCERNLRILRGALVRIGSLTVGGRGRNLTVGQASRSPRAASSCSRFGRAPGGGASAKCRGPTVFLDHPAISEREALSARPGGRRRPKPQC